MKIIACLFLLLFLTACATVGQAQGEQPVLPQQSPVTPSALESSVLLLLQNEAQHRDEIHGVDPATGQDLPGHPPITFDRNFGFTPVSTLSADGHKLALVTGKGQSCERFAGGSACRGNAEVLHLLDRPAWREVKIPLPAQGWVGQLAFNPAATQLALVYHKRDADSLMLFDISSKKLVAQRDLEFRPSLLAFSQDGATLITYGAPLGSDPGLSQPGPPVVLLLEASNLAVKWQQTLTGLASGYWCLENCQAAHGEQLFTFWEPALVLSPDRLKLYLIHADKESLTTVDFATQAVQSAEIQVAQSWFERFLALTAGVARAKAPTQGAFKNAVLSPDGTRLYVLGRSYETRRDHEGHWQVTENDLGLQVIEVESGHKIASHDSEALEIKLSPDGAFLILAGWHEETRWTEVLNAGSLQTIKRLEKWELIFTRRLDGRPIILASQPSQHETQLAMLDPQSFDIAHSWSVPAYASWLMNP